MLAWLNVIQRKYQGTCFFQPSQARDGKRNTTQLLRDEV